MATKQSRMHGRVEGARACVPCPGATRRESSRRRSRRLISTARRLALPVPRPRPRAQCEVQLFRGMSPEEITEAQSPLAGWERPSRRFAANGADPPPAWSDFADPFDAISGSFRSHPPSRRVITFHARPSSARCRSSGLARTPAGMRCASATPPWFAATTPTATAATAPRRSGLAGDRGLSAAPKSRGFRLVAVGCAERKIGADRTRFLDARETYGCARTRARYALSFAEFRRSARPNRHRTATARRAVRQGEESPAAQAAVGQLGFEPVVDFVRATRVPLALSGSRPVSR